jgi:hypothetical protein
MKLLIIYTPLRVYLIGEISIKLAQSPLITITEQYNWYAQNNQTMLKKVKLEKKKKDVSKWRRCDLRQEPPGVRISRSC